MHAGLTVGITSWVLEPAVSVPLATTAMWYASGALVLRRRAPAATHGARIACFAGGCTTLAVALLSPLHAASEQLFSAHMIQHELLMALAAPLLVLARPIPVLLWALPRPTRRAAGDLARTPAVRSLWRALTRPFNAWLIHALAIWIWHIPSLFQATLHSEAMHGLQHLTFLGSALIFWWSLIHAVRRAARGVSILYLFTTAVHTSALGALLTFSRAPWYPEYAGGAAAWGLTPLADQQLAGLIMWIPASTAYLVAALAVLRHWLRDSQWAAAEADRVLYAGSP